METIKDLDAVKDILSPGACFSPGTLRSFLRLSRKHSDDSLVTALPRVGSCAKCISETLFPAWVARDYILEYCDDVARTFAVAASHNAEPVSESGTETEKKVDPRFDPYGARDYGKTEAPPEDAVRAWISSERMVEEIVRDDSVRFLADKCGPIFLEASPTSTRLATSPESYMKAYDSYKKIHQN
ncbi:uncharacterized protein SAPINGB_P004439 [Magnusiomyces paraingens]|uniref:Uncharacterized protein n=1 Tax=Magnusiomyces paraingens TaxID=2606893 RepID=A0A5E8BWQ8_9ASCO|nr:uncharacterized protein SAPINGB_P004439 [Saprochaete ingens]VVT55124.1 unnamed protein product [Saprochaete ingens]